MKGGGCAEGKNLSAEMLIDTDLLVVSTRMNIYTLDFYIDIGNDRKKNLLKFRKIRENCGRNFVSSKF